MSNSRITGVVSVLGKEIAAAEKKRDALLAEAESVEQSIAQMKQVASGLEALFPEKKRRPGRTKKPARAPRRKAAAPASKETQLDPAMVLEAVASMGSKGAKRSALIEMVGNQTGTAPSRKAMNDALAGLAGDGRIRREGYHYVSADQGAAAEEQPVAEEAPAQDVAPVQEEAAAELDAPADDGPAQMSLLEEPAQEAPKAPARRGRPRKPVSDEVARGMAEVFQVIQQAGDKGCKSSDIRSRVEESVGVALSSQHTTRALKDLLSEGRVRREGYRYVAA